MSCWVWSRLLHHSSFGGIINGSRSFAQFPTKPKPNSTCAHPTPLPSSSATPQLVALEYKDLNLSHKFSEEVGHVRIRQHVNPLSNSFSIPIQVPDWNQVFRDPTLPLMVDIGSDPPLYVLDQSSKSSSLSTYRPAVILPGLGNNSADYQKLESTLRDYGISTVVAKVSRADWLRNAAGLLDPNYWQGTLRPRPVLDWYLKRVDDAVREAKELAQGGTLSLIGHSAGGWLARLYMEETGMSHISLLLTLGTPHLPPPKGMPGVIDQTRGLLNYVQENCSKAVYTPELKYVCIAGRYIQGATFFDNSNESVGSVLPLDSIEPRAEVAVPVMNNESSSKPVPTTFRARFVGQGYKQVCGKAKVWGDGVVPEESAHLDGALNISLEGVYHSPVGSDDALRPWYGSPTVLHQWIHHLQT